MIRLAAIVSAFGLAALLAGCPAFWVDRGDVVAPSRNLVMPTAQSLPPSNTYVDLRAAWERNLQIGLGGYVTTTLLDPSLTAAEIAHDAALEGYHGAELDTLLANRWTALYGADRDRFPIDVYWRFDEQFVSKADILDPANWSILLKTASGSIYQPSSTIILAATKTPREGLWEGTVRVWFPWRDPVAKTPLLGGQNAWVSLRLSHPSGAGEATWRFRPGY